MQDLEDKLLLLETMTGFIQDALYAIDEHGHELFYNNKIERFEPDHRQNMLAELLEVFKTDKQVMDKYQKYMTIDHQEVHMLSSLIPVKRNGKIIAVCSVNKNITEMAKLLNKVIKLQGQLQHRSQRANHSATGATYTFSDILGSSSQIQAVTDKAKKAALSTVSVLLTGETGTGKELFAQSIHNYGQAAAEPFVALNCAAIPETLLEGILFGTVKGAFTGAENTPGLLEQAAGGTLFLDEVNSMSVLLQSKLLRALEEKKVRRLGDSKLTPIYCRIISATNVDCRTLLAEGKMREDFYYRVAVINLTIPPLRERSEDVLVLTEHLLKRFNKIYGKQITRLSPEAANIFTAHRWPGNVRELYHALEYAVSFGDNETFLTPNHLPDYLRTFYSPSSPQYCSQPPNLPAASLPDVLADMEKHMIFNALTCYKGNVTKAAGSLGIHRQNLQARMKKLNILKKVNFFEVASGSPEHKK